MRKALVLWSGGVDSTTCLFKALVEWTEYEVGALFFNYSQVAYEAEMNSIRVLTRHIRAHMRDTEQRFLGFKVTSVAFPEHYLTGGAARQYAEGFASEMLPMRNAVFSTIAYYHARQMDADRVVIGIDAVVPHQALVEGRRPYPDQTDAWFDTVKKLFELENATVGETEFPITLEAPLAGLSKQEIRSVAAEYGVPIYATLSCHFPRSSSAEGNSPKLIACGECKACLSRKHDDNPVSS